MAAACWTSRRPRLLSQLVMAAVVVSRRRQRPRSGRHGGCGALPTSEHGVLVVSPAASTRIRRCQPLPSSSVASRRGQVLLERTSMAEPSARSPGWIGVRIAGVMLAAHSTGHSAMSW